MQNDENRIHLVVLVHGLWGNRSHLNEIRDYLLSLNSKDAGQSSEKIVVHQTRLNEGYKTYDGIDVCGIRVSKEIEEQIKIYDGKVVKFSLIGYSLGGLICRYALGVLYQAQLFKKNDIELVNFVTFCTPHIGVLAPGTNVAVKLFNTIVPLLLGNSGKQMFLKDGYNGYPLLYVMSLQNSVFYRALKQFKHKSLYANIVNDKRTAWWTSGISKNDPFIDVDERNAMNRFEFVKGYEPVILNNRSPLLVTSVAEDSDSTFDELASDIEQVEIDPQNYYFLNYWFRKTVRWVVVLFNLIIFAPLWFFWFILSGIMETIKSTIRATAFARKYSASFITEVLDISTDQVDPGQDDDYNTGPSTLFEATTTNYEMQIEQSLTDQRDSLIESLFEAIERRETRTATVENINDSDSIHVSEPSINVTVKDLEVYSIDELMSLMSSRVSQQTSDTCNSLDLLFNFHLDIGKQQLDIIESLNKLSWSKYPVYIRKTPSTHAAAIVRHEDPDFAEGHIVLQHFVDIAFQR